MRIDGHAGGEGTQAGRQLGLLRQIGGCFDDRIARPVCVEDISRRVRGDGARGPPAAINGVADVCRRTADLQGAIHDGRLYNLV